MRYRAVMDAVSDAAARSGRSPEDVTVVVVTKGRSAAEVAAVYEQGQRDFAENRAQELVEKTPVLPPDIRWHFVGPLQTNKVRLVRPVVCLLQSYDRDDLARAWLKGPGLAPAVLLQVNIGEEPQKHGFGPTDVEDACRRAIDLGLDVRGLMAIPPLVDDPELTRPQFARLRELHARVRARWPWLSELSMGMTNDFEVAVEEGATIIRPGRAIFGN